MQGSVKICQGYALIWLFKKYLFTFCCAGPFSICREQGPLFLEVGGFLIDVPSSVVEHGLFRHVGSVVAALGLSSCSTWTSLLLSMWNPPWPGIEPMSPALQGGVLTTGPRGKSWLTVFTNYSIRDKLCMLILLIFGAYSFPFQGWGVWTRNKQTLFEHLVSSTGSRFVLSS